MEWNNSFIKEVRRSNRVHKAINISKPLLFLYLIYPPPCLLKNQNILYFLSFCLRSCILSIVKYSSIGVGHSEVDEKSKYC